MKRHYWQAACWVSFGFMTPSLPAETDTALQANEPTPSNLESTIALALKALEKTDRSQWAYQVSRFENEEGDITQSVERFDPRLEDGRRWQLLTINGHRPTQKQREKFSNAKSEMSKQDKAPNYRLDLREIIRLETLRLDSKDHNQLNLRFDVNLPQFGEEASAALSGLLAYNKQAQFIERIEINNIDNFSPMFSASIEYFSLTMRFVKKQDAILPYQYELSMQGSFAFFTEINETSLDTYSEYELTKIK